MNLKTIEHFSPGNKALIYIHKRILDENYRGNISSQHNRFSLERISVILNLLNDFSNAKKQLLRIRTTDTKNRPLNEPEEFEYAKFTERVKIEIGIGTQDSLRKNFFVDFQRMGLINRYSEEKELLGAFSGSPVYYVDLSNLGLQFITSSPQNQNFIYSKALNNYLPGYIDNLIDLMTDEIEPLKYITPEEFMFFVSGINCGFDFSITYRECHELIQSYRLLSPTQRKGLNDFLKSSLKPENFKGNKKQQRDFHNWKNKADQMFAILSESVYFEKHKDYLVLTKKNGLFEDATKLVRSIQQKGEYFKNHGVGKQIGFELHHIIPLAYAVDVSSFKALDNWKNMLYIDGHKHSIITQQGSKHIFLSSRGNDLLLSDLVDVIELLYQKNVIYGLRKQAEIIRHNKELINGI